MFVEVNPKKMENNEDINIVELIPKIQKLLKEVNRSYWVTLIIFLSILSFLILTSWLRYLIEIYVWWGRGIDFYIELFEYNIYFFYVPLLMPIMILVIVIMDVSRNGHSMSSWKDIRDMLLFFKNIELKKNSEANGRVAEKMLKAILSIEKWLKTLWFNRYLMLIFLIFFLNLLFPYFLPSDMYVNLNNYNISIEFELLFIRNLSYHWFSILLIVLVSYIIIRYICKEQLQEWQLRIQKLQDNYKQFLDES
jgi:hypothetical protein